MAITRPQFILGLRLLFATIVLLFNTVAPVAKLMWPEQVTCGMACCLESGVCYCNSGSHSRSGEQNHDHLKEKQEGAQDGVDARPTAEIAAVTITSSCSAQCAQLPAGFQEKISKAGARNFVCAASVNHSPSSDARTPRFDKDPLLVASSAPRAPPSTLLRINSFIIQ
jgi:hypothetical protein